MQSGEGVRWTMHTKYFWTLSQLATANAAADFAVGGRIVALAGSCSLMGSLAYLCEMSQWLKVLYWIDSMSWRGVEVIAHYNREFC